MEQLPKTDVRIVDEFNFELLWRQHGSKVVTGMVVVGAFGLAAILWQKQAADRADTAVAVVAEATDVASLERVAREFAGKLPAAQALLRMGDLQFHSGRYADAANTYKRFLDDYPQHPFADSAALGLAASQESLGDLTSAKLQFQQLAAAKSAGYAMIAARIGAARCMEGLGQTNEARQAYEELLPAVQGTAWQTEAYLRWVTLARSYLASHDQVVTNQAAGAVPMNTTPVSPPQP